MFEDKYRSIFLSQMAAIVFIIVHIFFETRTVLKTGDSENHSAIPQL